MKISNEALFRGHGSDFVPGVMVDFCLATIMATGINLSVITCAVTKATTESPLVTVMSVDHVTSPGETLGERRSWEMPASMITRLVVHTPRGTDAMAIYRAIRCAPSRVRFYALGEREIACRMVDEAIAKENDCCIGMPAFLRLVKETQARMGCSQ